MRRSIALAGLLLAAASSAWAQMSTPSSLPGGGATSPFGTNLAGHLTGFGDASPGAATASPISSSNAPVTLSATGGQFSGTTFRPGAVFLTPKTPGAAPPGVELVSAPASGAGAAPVRAAVRGTTVFGAIGPRRFGLK